MEQNKQAHTREKTHTHGEKKNTGKFTSTGKNKQAKKKKTLGLHTEKTKHTRSQTRKKNTHIDTYILYNRYEKDENNTIDLQNSNREAHEARKQIHVGSQGKKIKNER